MVCPRCITSVENILNKLSLTTSSISLGEVVLLSALSIEQKNGLKLSLTANGFELLEAENAQVIDQIKTLIIETVHHQSGFQKVNYSTLISEKLNQDYTSLSKLFSKEEEVTIEKFILKQKIEKVKELLVYNELTLSEIAFQMNYSSAAYLSNQFKKETGYSPSAYKKLDTTNRKSLDAV